MSIFQRVGIKTALLDEKCTAIEMLICYAKELGAGFKDYVEPVLQLVIPHLKYSHNDPHSNNSSKSIRFYFHAGVRNACAAVLPPLFNSLILAGQGALLTCAIDLILCI